MDKKELRRKTREARTYNAMVYGANGFVLGVVLMILGKITEMQSYSTGLGDDIQLPLAVAYVAIFTVVGALIGYIRKPKPEDII